MRPIRQADVTGTGKPLNRQAVANYIAKYATKTLTAPGLPACRIRTEADIEPAALLRALPADDHHRVAARPPAAGPAWAHMLGYGGHFLTKSRRYSVTFGQLRAARADHRRATRPPERGPTPGAGRSMRPSSWSSTTWSYAGVGYATPAAELAAESAARAREHR